MKKYSEKFYKSKVWQDTREAYSKSVGMLCEDCLEHGIHTAGVIVHHIKPITHNNINDPNVTLSWNNLRLLCRPCHEKKHKRSLQERRYTIDEDGTVHIIET